MSTTPLFRRLALSVALSSLWLPAAHAEEVPTLAPVVVSGQDDTSPLQPGIKQEKARLQRVAGGTNLIEPQKEARLATLRDALDYQPGIVVQEFFGGIDQPRLNIRGSGVQSNPVNRGVLLLQDGLPLNEADGSFVIGFLEPRNSSLISVRRGANALSAGATTLGGELDFQSLTGTQKDEIGIEGGSFGRLGLHAAKGFQGEQLDGRLSVSHDKSDGYRHHSSSERTSVQGNFGVRGDNFENRTYLSYTDLKFDIPNVIPKDRLYSDPKSVLGDYNEQFDRANNIYQRDPNREATQLRLANRTYWGSEDLNQTFGVYWQNIDDTFTNPLVSSPTDGNTYGAQWQLAGKLRTLDYRVALDWASSDMDRELYVVNPNNGSRLQRFGNYDLHAENRSALLGLEWHMTPQWSLVGDLKYTQAIRDSKDRDSGARLDQDWSYASPKAGIIWKPADSLRWFANVSRSNEAPTYWEIIYGDVAQPLNPLSAATSMNRLDLQRATTYEIGGDGSLGAGAYAANWAVTLYRSRVEDELMSVSTANGTSAGTYNYRGRTRHQGIEAGLNGSLPAPGAGALDYRVAYTYSDFRFRGGEFDGNQIAGVPKHMVSAELLYRIGGWRFGPNVRWLPSDTPTNHANVPGTEQDAYAIWGLKLAYQHDKHWNAYLVADNLSDKIYASSYVIRNTGTAAMPTFLSGNGRSVAAGVNYRF
ncbi:TonB-dependent receptor family protein [Pollutimonas bauzanensis]|uniref:Iron complex outermembrane recepter protein n=1 Tax=Pollutimonas bauzanensis TaxID=658167 RepID=A0A1M5QT37_9BURK|nr:TonB-dependent receptor [Pollutimonas bauzanensis]SHH16940.1 iron complex outermembrane recepter protein [Pollutimonas bauzanensis]